MVPQSVFGESTCRGERRGVSPTCVSAFTSGLRLDARRGKLFDVHVVPNAEEPLADALDHALGDQAAFAVEDVMNLIRDNSLYRKSSLFLVFSAFIS